MDKAQQIIEIMEEFFNLDKGVLNEASRMEDIEAWDSLAHVMLIGEVEERMNVSIPMDVAAEIASVKQLVDAVM